ncbi:MAG: c-type cytochrome [Pseudomonadota bacterium]
MKTLSFPMRPLTGGLLIAVAALAGTAHAEPGRLLAAQCAQCHGTNGAGPGFDSIAGKNAGELYHELVEMKYRPIESIMDRQARGYTEDQLLQISNYLSTLPGGGDD